MVWLAFKASIIQPILWLLLAHSQSIFQALPDDIQLLRKSLQIPLSALHSAFLPLLGWDPRATHTCCLSGHYYLLAQPACEVSVLISPLITQWSYKESLLLHWSAQTPKSQLKPMVAGTYLTNEGGEWLDNQSGYYYHSYFINEEISTQRVMHGFPKFLHMLAEPVLSPWIQSEH